MQPHHPTASTTNGFLSVKQFKKDPLAETSIGKLFLALLEEKEWSKDFSAMVCFDKGKAFITIFSEELFSFSRFVRFQPTEELPATMEGIRLFILRNIFDEESKLIDQERRAKHRETLLHKMAEKIFRNIAFQLLRAKAPSGRVYLPKRKNDVWYAVNSSRILVTHECDVGDRNTVYALENMTQERFEKERLGLPFRSMVKGATKL